MREFKTIICSSGNKNRLQTTIKAQLTGIAQYIKQEVLYSVGEDCTSLSSETSLDELSFSQCEADTFMLLCDITITSQGIFSSTLPIRTCTCTQLPSHTTSLAGCDSNSCFYVHGKLSLFQRMAKSAEVCSLLLKCGESLQLSDDVLNDFNIYSLRYVYGDVRSSSLDVLRVDKWRCQKKK